MIKNESNGNRVVVSETDVFFNDDHVETVEDEGVLTCFKCGKCDKIHVQMSTRTNKGNIIAFSMKLDEVDLEVFKDMLNNPHEAIKKFVRAH